MFISLQLQETESCPGNYQQEEILCESLNAYQSRKGLLGLTPRTTSCRTSLSGSCSVCMTIRKYHCDVVGGWVGGEVGGGFRYLEATQLGRSRHRHLFLRNSSLCFSVVTAKAEEERTVSPILSAFQLSHSAFNWQNVMQTQKLVKGSIGNCFQLSSLQKEFKLC